MSLILKNVSKTFAGKKAVDNISFSLEKPGVYGLLGTNRGRKNNNTSNVGYIIETQFGRNILWRQEFIC